MNRGAYWCVVVAGLWLAASSQALFAATTHQYDPQFRSSNSRFLPMWDWRWLKAQCYQESRLNPLAKSPVGAQGLCQFMPGTWSDVSRPLGFYGQSPFMAELSIEAAAYYNAKLRLMWKAPRPESERRKIVQASYNAGAGHILKAQRLCNNASDWGGIKICLGQVTGKHSDETLQYVARIEYWYSQITRGLL